MDPLQLLADELETVSCLYAERYGIDRDDNWFVLKLREEVSELTKAFLMRAGQAVTRDVRRPSWSRHLGAHHGAPLGGGYAERARAQVAVPRPRLGKVLTRRLVSSAGPAGNWASRVRPVAAKLIPIRSRNLLCPPSGR